MRRVNRREFAKLVAGTALVAPLAPGLAWTQEAAKKFDQSATKPADTNAPQQPDAAKPEAKPKLTPEQETAVKQAVERRERQLAGLRAHTLPYDAEPEFVFTVRQRPRGASKGE